MPPTPHQAIRPHSLEALEQCRMAGVQMPEPRQVFIDQKTPLSALAPGAVILPGVRIFGAESRVERGAVLGEGGPVTLQQSWVGENARVGVLGAVQLQETAVGPGTVLGAGSAEHAVFLGKEAAQPEHTCGWGFRLRKGTLYEEDASSAQFTDCKMTILFPWATLGSQVNFCDVLLYGGESANPPRI